MSLRVRLTLLLALTVAATLLVAGLLTRRAVLAPFTRGVVAEHLDQAAYVADELEWGADPEELAHRLGVDVAMRRRPPGFMSGRGGRDGRFPCERREHRSREVLLCHGPRSPVAVALADGMGWVVIRRDLDTTAPAQRIGIVLGVLALVIIALSALIAVRITRPLAATVAALRHVEAGELGHRLPQSGGPELRQVAQAFNAMIDRIDGMLRAEKEMMAGISHELRTPLARLRLQLELLRDGDTPSNRLDAMEEDVAEVDHLIDELLELSRLSLGAGQLRPTQVDLRALVDEAVSRYPLSRHRVQVTGDRARAVADRERLARVIGNLLQNAGKYAPPDTTVHVTVQGSSIEVRDEGSGVPEADRQRLFEPFYRGQRGERSSATGYGLGLMYARQVVELCHGSIEAENAPAGGLVIRITLPSGEDGDEAGD